VTPNGERNPRELAEECEKVDKEFGQGLADFPKPVGVTAGSQLFVKSGCGFSRAALLARDNLHLERVLPVKNVSEDAAARSELVRLVGKDQAPCLIQGGKPMHESEEIIKLLVNSSSDLPT
jgi:hypothetical protein